MKRRDFLNLMALSPLALSACEKTAPRSPKKPPNFLVILSDDMEPEALGCYGNNEAQSPHIDQLAKEGVFFNNCWATPMCSPSRALLMTGRYADKTGWYHNALKFPGADGSANIQKNHNIFSQLLKARGYATAITGKWQLPGKYESTGDWGFDEYCLWQPHEQRLPKGAVFNGPREPKQNLLSRYWHPAIVKNGKLIPTTKDDFGPDICTEFLIDFIKRSKTDNKPFMAYYPMILPHNILGGGWPHVPGRKPNEKNKKNNFLHCYDYIDSLVGRIVNCLDQMNLRENTVIIFSADNPRKGKIRATENGARVPLVINGPGIVKNRRQSHELVSLADIFPTLMDFADISMPVDYRLDGISLTSYLEGTRHEHRKYLYSYIGTAQMIRDKQWLLEAVDPYHNSPDGRLYRYSDQKDPAGKVNVSNSSSPEALEARKHLKKILESFPMPKPDNPPAQKIIQKYLKHKHKHRLHDKKPMKETG